MRRVKNVTEDRAKTSEVILSVCRTSADPQRGGIGVEEMRTRIRIMDVIEADQNADEWLMEDSDFANLTRIFQAANFMMADRNLLKVIDSILGSETVKPHLKSVKTD